MKRLMSMCVLGAILLAASGCDELKIGVNGFSGWSDAFGYSSTPGYTVTETTVVSEPVTTVYYTQPSYEETVVYDEPYYLP